MTRNNLVPQVLGGLEPNILNQITDEYQQIWTAFGSIKRPDLSGGLWIMASVLAITRGINADHQIKIDIPTIYTDVFQPDWRVLEERLSLMHQAETFALADLGYCNLEESLATKMAAVGLAA